MHKRGRTVNNLHEEIFSRESVNSSNSAPLQCFAGSNVKLVFTFHSMPVVLNVEVVGFSRSSPRAINDKHRTGLFCRHTKTVAALDMSAYSPDDTRRESTH